MSVPAVPGEGAERTRRTSGVARSKRPRGGARKPTLRLERELLRSGVVMLAAADEVGRGALCGPATVGVVVVTEQTRSAPRGVRDSKLLTAAAREELVAPVQQWAHAWAVGHAGPDEVDQWGIIAALRVAGHRALAQLPDPPDAVLLDGNYDYLTPPEPPEPPEAQRSEQASLFAEFEPGQDAGPELAWAAAFGSGGFPAVHTRVKADMVCAAVAAASILAKTARDRIMVELAADYPEYGWQSNKGYAAADHCEALCRLGPTPHHRRSWRLPGAVAAAVGD